MAEQVLLENKQEYGLRSHSCFSLRSTSPGGQLSLSSGMSQVRTVGCLLCYSFLHHTFLQFCLGPCFQPQCEWRVLLLMCNVHPTAKHVTDHDCCGACQLIGLIDGGRQDCTPCHILNCNPTKCVSRGTGVQFQC